MTLYQVILSGILQGLTEFLPISSSGHLVLLHNIFGIKTPQVTFDIYLHLGTLLAVFIVFFKELVNIFTTQRKKAFLLIVAMIPTILAALLFHSKIESLFVRPRLSCFMLIITGIWLIAGSLRQNLIAKKSHDINLWQAILIGCAQSLSLLPGLSRSGSTIATGLLCGIDQRKAVTFSFLLSILAISSAAIFKAEQLPTITESVNLKFLIVGVLTSFIFGFLAIKLVIRTISYKKLHYFGWYCIVGGILGYIFLK